MLRCELLIALACMACSASMPAHTLPTADGERTYLLHLPAQPPGGRYPLVIALHGGTSTAEAMREETRFDELADREGFAVVYPQGRARQWNDGRIGNGATSVDDVAFVRTLIDSLVAAHPIDPDRVYVTGISNGGIMSYRLGCELADKIAAIAPVAGQVSAFMEPRCAPVRPFAVLAISGTGDPVVPWRGGTVMGGRGEVISTPRSIELMARVNRCTAAPVATWEPDRDPDDGTNTQHVVYGGCAAGSAVELINVNRGGHTWPGGRQYLSKGLIGPVSREFSASERIWNFFALHGRNARP